MYVAPVQHERSRLSMKETFERGGCTWEVVRRYQLTDEYMREHNLYYRNRITIRCIKPSEFIPTGFVMDYADTERR